MSTSDSRRNDLLSTGSYDIITSRCTIVQSIVESAYNGCRRRCFGHHRRYCHEPEKKALIRLTAGTQLIAPHSVHWEIGNAFSAMLRRKRTTPDIIAQALGVYRQIPIRFVDVELDESLEIADVLGIYAYDAYLIRCAQKYSAPLISLDAGLMTSAKRSKVRVIEVNP